MFPGDAWEFAFRVLDEGGRPLECVPSHIKASLRPRRAGAPVPALHVRAVATSSGGPVEAKRRRASYSSLPSSFILSLLQPVPAGVRGFYDLECEVLHGDMEIQLQVRTANSLLVV